jgi:hypothetical protein
MTDEIDDITDDDIVLHMLKERLAIWKRVLNEGICNDESKALVQNEIEVIMAEIMAIVESALADLCELGLVRTIED